MSMFSNFFSRKNPAPPKTKKEPIPVEPPPVQPQPPKRKSMFQGLEIKGEAKKETKEKPSAGMFGGLELNTEGAEGNRDDEGTESAFGFLGGDEEPSSAFGFLDGDDNDGGADDPAATDEGKSGEAGEPKGGDETAFGFLNPGADDETSAATDPKPDPVAEPKVSTPSATPKPEASKPEPKVSDSNGPASKPSVLPEKAAEEKVHTEPTVAAAGSTMFDGLNMGENEASPIDSFFVSQQSTEPDQPAMKPTTAQPTMEQPKPLPEAKAAPVEPEKTQAERLYDATQAQLRDVMATLCAAKRRFYEQRTKLEKEESGAQTGIQEARAALSKAEAKEAEAIEKEDYEAADTLSTTIDSLKADIKMKQKTLHATTQSKIDLDGEKVLSIVVSLRGLEAAAKDFTRMQDTQAEEKDKYLSERTTQLQRLEDKAAADLERVERKLGHTEVDRKHVDEEEADIIKAIESQTEGVVDEKKVLDSEALAIEAEIEELRRKLEEREGALRVKQAAIDVCAGKIQEAAKGYERQLKRIAEKREGIKADQNEAEEEKMGLQNQVDSLSQQAKELKEKEEEFNSKIGSLETHAKSIGKLVGMLAEEKEVVSSWTEASSAGSGSETQGVLGLNKHLAEITSKVTQISEAKDQKDHELAELRDNIESMAIRLPELDRKKKAAVKRRAFKDAAKVNAEIKEIGVEKANAQKGMETVIDAIETLKGELREETKAKASVESSLEKAMSVEDERRLEMLEALLAIGRQQFSSELQLPQSVKSLHQAVLEEERTVLQFEADKLRARHGWAPDFKRLAVPEDTKEAAPSEVENQEGGETVPEVADAALFEESGGVVEEREEKDEGKVGVDVAEVRRKLETAQAELAAKEARMKAIDGEVEDACAAEDYDKAAELDEEKTRAEAEIDELKATISKLSASLPGGEDAQETSAAIDNDGEVPQPAELETPMGGVEAAAEAEVAAPTEAEAEVETEAKEGVDVEAVQKGGAADVEANEGGEGEQEEVLESFSFLNDGGDEGEEEKEGGEGAMEQEREAVDTVDEEVLEEGKTVRVAEIPSSQVDDV